MVSQSEGLQVGQIGWDWVSQFKGLQIGQMSQDKTWLIL
jgi:hypothetical protein